MQRSAAKILEALLAGSILCAMTTVQAAQQDPTPGAASPSQANRSGSETPSETVQQPPKKVWTNDDIGSLRQDSVISTFGKPQAASTKNGAKPNPSPKAKWYQGRIAGLEAEIPPIDQQIGELEAALSGQPVNSLRKWGATKPDDWRAQLDELERKRDAIQAQIATLKDQARHDGVLPSTLP